MIKSRVFQILMKTNCFSYIMNIVKAVLCRVGTLITIGNAYPFV